MPRLPRFLLAVILLLALFQITNLLTVLQLPAAITARQTLPAPLSAGLSGLWAALFSGSAVHLCRRGVHAVRYANWLIAAFIGYSWLRWFIFAQAEYDQGRLPCVSVFILLGLILLLWRSQHGEQPSHSSGENKSNDP